MPEDLGPELDDPAPAWPTGTGLRRQKPALTQDPHHIQEITERNLEAAIGRGVRRFQRR